MTSCPSPSDPRSEVNPPLASTRRLAVLSGWTLARRRTPAASAAAVIAPSASVANPQPRASGTSP